MATTPMTLSQAYEKSMDIVNNAIQNAIEASASKMETSELLELYSMKSRRESVDAKKLAA